MAQLPAPAAFALVMGYLGLFLTVTSIPGLLTVDETNYIATVVALRQGRLSLASLEGLPVSRELLAFDPTPKSRLVSSASLAPSAPPLYAPIALPFSFFGWRGLVALNTLAYLFTTTVVFAYAARYSRNPSVPWLAATAFAVGGYTIEYAQGLWPHMLSVALCTAGIVLAGRAVDGGVAAFGAAAGFLLALATGVRYQNAVMLGTVGAAVLMWARKPFRSAAAYGAAAAVPLGASSIMNYLRLGSLNPVSKGEGYLALQVIDEPTSTSLRDAVLMLWARLIDFSVRPPVVGPAVEHWLRYDADRSAHIVIDYVVKKALLESAPWAIIGFIGLALAWRPSNRAGTPRVTQLRLLSLVVAAVAIVFALAGPRRHDGLAFNERYLLELLPLLAVAFAWAMDSALDGRSSLVIGTLVGACLATGVFFTTPLGDPDGAYWIQRQHLHITYSAVLATALGSLWILSRFLKDAAGALTIAAGAALAWGCLVHGSADLYGSRRTRAFHAVRTSALASVLPDHSALVAYYWEKESAGPLLLTHDVVLVNPWVDDGADAPALIDAFLKDRRRVFVLTSTMPEHVRENVLGRRSVVVGPCCLPQSMPMVEILPK